MTSTAIFQSVRDALTSREIPDRRESRHASAALITEFIKDFEPLESRPVIAPRVLNVDWAPDARRQEANPTKVGSGVAQASMVGHAPWQPHFLNRKHRRTYSGQGNPIIEKSILLNKWEGEIIEVCESDQTFTARLYDLARPNLMEFGEFDFEDVGLIDRPMLKPGAQFYWYLMNEDSRSGRREARSLVWFKRCRRETAAEREAVKSRLDDIWETFGWGDNFVEQGATSG